MSMTRNNWKGHAALVIACVALALSIVAAVRGSARGPGPGTCVDQEARDQVNQLRRAIAERQPLASAGSPPSPPPAPGPRRYVRFEIPNPAVSVTQKADGTFDIRSTDPSLAGSILTVTAISESGAQDKMFIRIPR